MTIQAHTLPDHQKIFFEDANKYLKGKHSFESPTHQCHCIKTDRYFAYREVENVNFFDIRDPQSFGFGVLLHGGMTAAVAYCFFSSINPTTAVAFSLCHKIVECLNHALFGEKTSSITGTSTTSYEIKTNEQPRLFSPITTAALTAIVALPFFITNIKALGIYAILSTLCSALTISSSREVTRSNIKPFSPPNTSQIQDIPQLSNIQQSPCAESEAPVPA